MSLNLEKHLNPKKKYRKPEKEFVKCVNEKDVMKLRVERLMQHPVSCYFRSIEPSPQLMELLRSESMIYRGPRRLKRRPRCWSLIPTFMVSDLIR